MDINDKIRKVLFEYKSLNITMIEVTPLSFKKISEDVLNVLEERNIRIIITEEVKDFRAYNYKYDCFAYKNKRCDALTDIDCVGCRFYKKR